MNRELFIDYEVYSELDLTKVGAAKLVRHPSTEVILAAWAIDDDPMRLWDPASGDKLPIDLIDALEDEECDLVAFNAAFERKITQEVLGIDSPAFRWKCAMVYAYSFGFSGGLDQVARQMTLPERKLSSGKGLIHRFCKPAPASHKVRRYGPQTDVIQWEMFRAYCVQDAEMARRIWRSLNNVTRYSVEWRHYDLDQKINDRGLPVDLELVDAAMNASASAQRALIRDLRESTGMSNPKSRDQFMEWQKSIGLGLHDATKDTLSEKVRELAAAEEWGLAKILEQKIQLGKTSTSKWERIEKAAHLGRVYDTLQFLGAGRTGRWAGRILQPQNLPRPTIDDVYMAADLLLQEGYDAVHFLYDNVMEVMSSLVRSAITASPGKVLNVADLSGIETRSAGWICEDAAINAVYARNGDIYTDFGSYFLNKPEEEITKAERQFLKPVILGAQYLLGAKGLQVYAYPFGVALTRKEARRAVTAYRRRYTGVVQFWSDVEAAYFEATEGGTASVGPGGCISMSQMGPFLRVRLPTGRALFYFQPRLEERTLRWEDDEGNMQETTKVMFTYMGRKQNFPWMRIAAHAGHMLENIDQALSRDVLMSGLLRADEARLNVVGHVHDEIICEEETDRLDLLNECLSTPLKWAPGLKLASEGYVARRYRK